MAVPLYELAFGVALACFMLAIAVSDCRRYRVPDPLVALALITRLFDLVPAPQ